MNYASTANIQEVMKFYNLFQVTKLLKKTLVTFVICQGETGNLDCN